MTALETADKRLHDARAELEAANATVAEKERRHRDDVINSARESELKRSESEWHAAQSIARRAKWAAEAREQEFQAARAKAAEDGEAERKKNESAAWEKKDDLGKKINAQITALAETCREFCAADDEILKFTPGDRRSGTRELLGRLGARFLSAITSAISPDATPCALTIGADHLRLPWNDKNPGTFYTRHLKKLEPKKAA